MKLLDIEKLKLWLENPGHINETDVPPAVRAMFLTISDSKLAEHWCELLEYDAPIPSELIFETRNKLLEIGYRPDFVAFLVVALIGACIKSSVDFAVNFSLPISQLPLRIAQAILGGLSGAPDLATIDWLLSHAADCGDKDAVQLMRTLAEAENGDPNARLKIVQLVIPFWYTLADADLLSRWDKHAVMLGLPYQYAKDIEDHPEVLALRARLLYVNGHAGDEDEAVRIAVEAAISGSVKAWSLLNDWQQTGDDKRVLRFLLSVGSAKLSGVDCFIRKG